ncbi:hypothetical protein U2S91_08395 [Stenotrophomonas maltophilia]|nr:hypothetical protein [Stenotrophomonas maltophilia]WQI22642.1 hypothetical protein U2S91_08395 [Stenotrophomonas maltophilia]
MKKPKNWFYLVVNGLLFLSGLAALVAGGYCTFRLQAAAATTFFGAGLVLLFASTIDRFETLKGFGIEAKQRELTKTLSEVNTVLEEVQQLNFFTAKSLAALYAKAGRAAGAPSAEEIYSVLAEFRTSLKRGQATDGMVREALAPCVDVMLADLNHAITGPVKSALGAVVAERWGEFHLSDKSDRIAWNDKEKAYSEAAKVHHDILEFQDFSEATYPGELITLLRSYPANLVPEAEIAAKALASFSGDIQSLQRRGIIDDTAMWFATTGK